MSKVYLGQCNDKNLYIDYSKQDHPDFALEAQFGSPSDYKEIAEEIVEDILDYKSKRIDLTKYTNELAELLWTCHKEYQLKWDDWEIRNTNPPKRKLKDNWEEEPDCPHDYRELAGVGLENWDKHYNNNYKRGPGNQGAAQIKGAPPIAPLYPIYEAVRTWWSKHAPHATQSAISNFKPNHKRVRPEFHLLCDVIESLNGDYEKQVCINLYRTNNKRNKKKTKAK